MGEKYTLKKLGRDIRERASEGRFTGGTISYEITSSNSEGVGVLRIYRLLTRNISESCYYDSKSEAENNCINEGIENLQHFIQPMIIRELSRSEGKVSLRIKQNH